VQVGDGEIEVGVLGGVRPAGPLVAVDPLEGELDRAITQVGGIVVAVGKLPAGDVVVELCERLRGGAVDDDRGEVRADGHVDDSFVSSPARPASALRCHGVLKILARRLSYRPPSIGGVLSAVTLAARPEFAVTTVTCRVDHIGWTQPEARDDYRLVLLRRGRFRRGAAGADADLDPTMAYLGGPGEERRCAHPAGGDVCPSVRFVPGLWDGIASGLTVYIDARVDLAHRRLLTAATASGDLDYAVAEELLRLVAVTAGQPAGRPGPAD